MNNVLLIKNILFFLLWSSGLHNNLLGKKGASFEIIRMGHDHGVNIVTLLTHVHP